jgi:hypothetical protein
MKLYRILKTFTGSQHGNDHQQFEAGTTALLSNSLATIVVKEGWAVQEEPAREEKAVEPVDENKAIEAAPENKSRKKK